MPSTKVGAATIAAALGSIIVWALKQYVAVDLPAEVSAAVVVLLTLIVGYVVPEQNPAPSAVETVREKGLA